MSEHDSDFILAYRKISCNIYDHERNYTETTGFKQFSAEFKKEIPHSSCVGKADRKNNLIIIKGPSKNVIPAKAGIQKVLKSLDSRRSLPRDSIRGGNDELMIIRGSLKMNCHE
jgi:hypothetical protein